MLQRQISFDLTKLFAIFIVLWGHSVQFMGGGDFWTNPVFEFIYSFHMPLFMVISGYFFSSGLRYSFGEIFKKKITQLLLPVLSWVLVISISVYLWRVFVLGWSIPLGMMIKDILLSLKGDLWFLKCLFSCYMVSYLAMKVCKKEWLACLVVNLFFLLVPSFFGEMFLILFFWMGFFLKRYSEWVSKYQKHLLNGSFLSFIFLFLFWNGRDTVYAAPIHTLYNWEIHAIDFTNYGTALFRLVIGAMGSLWIILFFKEIVHESVLTKRMGEWGRHTMGVYILQYYVLQVWLSHYHFSPMSAFVYNFVATPIFAAILLLLCLYCCRLIEKNRYTNFLFLGTLFKNKEVNTCK